MSCQKGHENFKNFTHVGVLLGKPQNERNGPPSHHFPATGIILRLRPSA